MVASGYGAVDRVAKAGDSMTGTLILSGANPLQITTTSPGAGKVLTSDASGNVSWGSGVTAPMNLSGSQASASILSVTNTTSAPSIAALLITSQAAGDRSVGVQVTGDTNRRLSIDSTGKHQWGSGSAGADTNLYRASAGVLCTDGALTVGGAAATAGGIQVGSTTTAFGGGTGVIGLTNATTVPNTNPASGLVMYADQDIPKWRSSNGDIYSGGETWLSDAFRPTGAIAETMPRWGIGNSQVPNSGELTLAPIWLPRGVTISNITWLCCGQSAISPTHQWAGLYNSAKAQLAVTADKTTTAITSGNASTCAIATTAAGAASSFTTTYAGLHYLGLMIAASTMPDAAGNFIKTAAQQPPTCGTSDTGQTTPPAFPHTAASPASPNRTIYLYMYVS